MQHLLEHISFLATFKLTKDDGYKTLFRIRLETLGSLKFSISYTYHNYCYTGAVAADTSCMTAVSTSHRRAPLPRKRVQRRHSQRHQRRQHRHRYDIVYISK